MTSPAHSVSADGSIITTLLIGRLLSKWRKSLKPPRRGRRARGEAGGVRDEGRGARGERGMGEESKGRSPQSKVGGAADSDFLISRKLTGVGFAPASGMVQKQERAVNHPVIGFGSGQRG